MQQSPLQPLFLALVKQKQQIIKVWYLVNWLIFAGIIGMIVIYFQQQYILQFSQFGLWAGQFAVVLFCITITPGILRRFQIKWKIKDIIMLFRRQFGIFTFIFAFIHYLTMKVLPTIAFNLPLTIGPLFEIMGALTVYTMSIVFFTSNDVSVRKLGKWWARIHSLVYIIAWTLFLHIYFQGGDSVWGYLIGVFALLETASLILAPLLKPKVVTPPPQSV